MILSMCPEHMRMASESASDEEVYMTDDDDDDDDESEEEELANHGRIFISSHGCAHASNQDGCQAVAMASAK